MILQALNDYYQRVMESGDSDIAPPGWVRKPVDFIVVLDPSGRPVSLQCRQIIEKGKRKPGKAELLPNIGKQALKHTNSGVDANLLWDNAAFALGFGKGGLKKLGSFITTITTRFPEPNESIQALLRFLRAQHESQDTLDLVLTSQTDREALASGAPVVTFSLSTDRGQLLCHREDIRQLYETSASKESVGPRSVCLITGENDVAITENETVIKRVWNAQSSGANIISFNKRAFESYGKTERGGENSPISKSASFAYTTALNHLLRENSRNRTQVGDASTVFWAEREDELETAIPDLFGEPPKDNPDRHVDAVKALYRAIDTGRLAGPDGTTRYYVLGLSPNAARIAVRFFHCLPLRDLAGRIKQHFNDVQIAHRESDPEQLSLKRLLQGLCLATKTQPFGDIDRLPPNIGGALVDAILAGPNAPYPHQLLNLAVVRCRAEQDVSYPRAAAIKAFLNRSIRRHPQEKEFQPMLDPDNTNVAYRLGRLFAVLEKIQEEASGGSGKLNSTIRDRYYGAASSSPGTVFPMLLKLKNHHISKLDDRGNRMLYRAFQDHKPDDYIGAVLWGPKMNEIPAHLTLADQGCFALGYYHQRQAFFTKSDKTPSTESTEEK